MKFQLVLSVLVACAAAVSVDFNQNGVSGNAQLDGTVAGVVTENELSGAVAGTGKANVDQFGEVNVQGNAAGTIERKGDKISAAGAVAGSARAGEAFITGGAAGNANVDLANGSGSAEGDIAGSAGMNGIRADGSAKGKVSGDLSGRFQAAGIANGCIQRGERRDCYNGSKQLISSIYANGTIVKYSVEDENKTSGSGKIVVGFISFAGALAVML
jgi:hypothetical protein